MVRKFGHAEDPKDRIHFSNAGFSTCGCREGTQTPPLPLRPHLGFKCRAGKYEVKLSHSRQRSTTLGGPNFSLKNGEHLTAFGNSVRRTNRKRKPGSYIL